MGLRHAAIGALITTAPLAPAMSHEATVFAEGPNRVCVDINGGPIDTADNLPVIEIQQAVGAVTDGDFGQDTCDAVWSTLIQEGRLTGNGTTLKMSSKVLSWLKLNPANDPEVNVKPASSALECEAEGNYPSEVKDLGNFSIMPPTSSRDHLTFDIDKSTHKAIMTLTLHGLVDFDYIAATGACVKDLKESGDHDIVSTSYVAVNQSETPEGTFSLGKASDATCYNDKCVLKDFQPLQGKDSRNGKPMNGNIGIHRIPRNVPKGMTIQEALDNIDSLPSMHPESELQWRTSTACIRVGKAVKALLGRYPATVKIKA